MIKECELCKKLKVVSYSEKLKKFICKNCYKREVWIPKNISCKRCKREMPMQAHGLCRGCYNSVFHIDKVKAYNAQKYHNISVELYKKVTFKCLICGFDKIVELHHLDFNHFNNSENNLLGLCPNHHKMIHDRRYRKEVLEFLKSKGYTIQKVYEDDEVFKK